MAAKPPRLLVDCPPPSRHDGGSGGMQRRESRNGARGRLVCVVAVLVLVFAAMITGLTFLGIFLNRKFPSKDPVFTVAITGVTGLDVLSPAPPSQPPADDNYRSSSPMPALSPVFNLTFQIDNTRNAFSDTCFPDYSRADVSYVDAFLASGSVPPMCVGTKKRAIIVSDGGVPARVWGDNVAVPRFLRDQLAAELIAGDASVHVKVTMPEYCGRISCGDAMLSCKPKIGGGMSPACRLDFLN